MVGEWGGGRGFGVCGGMGGTVAREARKSGAAKEARQAPLKGGACSLAAHKCVCPASSASPARAGLSLSHPSPSDKPSDTN